MMRFFEILSFLLAWGYTAVFFLILKSFLPLRKNVVLKVIAFLVCGYLADSIIYSNDAGSLFGTMLLFFLYVLLFYRGTFMEKLSVMLVFYPALIAINYLMLDTGGRLFKIITQASYEETLQSPTLMLISTAIYTVSLLLRLLFWIGAWLVLRRFLEKIPSHLNIETWLIIDMLILASFVAIFTIIYFMPENTAIVYPICGASIFSSFGCMYLAAYIYDSMQTAYRVQQMETQRDYYKERIAEEERVRSIYHDLKNHLLVMESRQNTAETRQMAETLRSQIADYEDYVHTGNEFLDIILKDKAELVQNIEGLSGLEATGRLYSQVFTHKIGASALENIQTYYNADDRLTYIEATDAGLAEAYHDMIDSGECTSILYGIDGLILDTFAQDGRMLDGTFDKGKFLSGGYVVMEAATGAEDSGKETQPTYSVGDTVELNGQQYEVMAIVADIPTITEGVNSSTQDFLSFYLPADTFRAMYPDNTLRKLFFDVVEEYQPQAEEMLIQYQQDVDKSLNYTAKSTLIEHYQEQTRANTVMGFAISLIIAFVGILNFVNSMVTAIVSRQKEFAMIQSIGMTKRQLRRMLIDEGLYYAGSTLLAAYVLGTVAVAVGVRMMVAGDWTATFHFTLLPLGICTPILIAFAIVIPYICFKNLEKQSIVERLRATD